MRQSGHSISPQLPIFANHGGIETHGYEGRATASSRLDAGLFSGTISPSPSSSQQQTNQVVTGSLGSLHKAVLCLGSDAGTKMDPNWACSPYSQRLPVPLVALCSFNLILTHGPLKPSSGMNEHNGRLEMLLKKSHASSQPLRNPSSNLQCS